MNSCRIRYLTKKYWVAISPVLASAPLIFVVMHNTPAVSI